MLSPVAGRMPAREKGNDMRRDESGQATAEYALVMVAAAAIGLALVVWAANSDLLPRFFDAVVRRITGLVQNSPAG